MTTEITAPVVMDFRTVTNPNSDMARQIRKAADDRLAGERKQGGIKDLADGKTDIFRVNPYLIRVKDGWNSRDPNDTANHAHIDLLAQSIAENGVLEAVTVFWEGGAPTLTDGHCRLLATFRAIEVYGADVRTIPAKTEVKGADEAQRLASQIIRNSGKPLSALEMATVCFRLTGYGWAEKDIAKKAGLSPSRVGQLLELHAAPAEVKRMVAAGEVSATLVRDVMRKNDQDGAAAARELKDAVTKAKDKGKSKATAKDAGMAKGINALKQELRGIFAKAEINDTPKKGQPVTIAMDEDLFTRMREAVGF